MRLPYRFRQALFFVAASRQAPPQLPLEAEALLAEPMLLQFRMLTPGDQRHLLRVYRYLRAHAADDDVVTAGLIHDVGKACRACRIRLVHRTLHVLLGQFAPRPYARFARTDEPPRPLLALHRLANHAERGARAAELAGYNPRVCGLVRDHESGGDPHDTGLRLLRQADERADHTWDAPSH